MRGEALTCEHSKTEMLHSIALTFIPGITPSMQLELLRHYDSAEDIIMRPEETLKDLNADFRLRLVKTINSYRDQAIKAATEEMAFCQQHRIKVLDIKSKDYPYRLEMCSDAPAVLYYRGEADLNAKHVLAVVGTRKITEYGKQVCARLTERLAQLLPDTLVISGLAYGVDIHAHRGAMEHGLPTVAVVAHGLDQIYPSVHRNDARRMASNGGILTEYIRGTRPLQGNFLRRNRIVAGMADATIVVESAEHGGSLVTARIANSYEREVFAFPGRVNDPASVGCNNLILNQKAHIALTADDIIKEQGWWEETTEFRSKPQQFELFSEEMLGNARQAATPAGRNAQLPPMPPEQLTLAQALQGTDGLNAAKLAELTGQTPAAVSTTLFDMELMNIVKVLPGGFYILKK